MFIYTDNDIASHRNTQNINILPKTHTQIRKCILMMFKLFERSEIYIFQRDNKFGKSALYADVYGIIYIVEGQTA